MRRAVIVLVLLGAVTTAGAQGPDAARRVPELVGRLGSDDFDKREQASRELEALGPAALPALSEALKSATDAEVVRRLRALVRRLEDRELTEKLLAPRRVRLAVKQATVADAVAELSKASGYPIHLPGAGGVGGRRVTLDTGEVPFWDALGRLCKEAGLVEDPSLMGPFAGKPAPPIGEWRKILAAPPGIHLMAGEPAPVPTAVAGSVRVRVVKVVAAPGGAIDLVLEVSGEPRLIGLEPAGGPGLVKASDSRGRALELVSQPDEPAGKDKQVEGKILGNRGGGWVVRLLDGTVLKGNTFGPAPPVTAGPCLVTLRLRGAEKGAKSIKELAAKLVLQTAAETEPGVVIDDVLKAAGKSAKAADGSRLTVESVEQLDNKDVRLKVTWEQPLSGKGLGTAGAIGGKIVARGGKMEISGGTGDRSPAALEGAPRLLGEAGDSWPLAEWSSQGWTVTAAQAAHSVTLVYRPGPKQRAPARLVASGRKTFALEVPFTFRDVPLPE